MADQALLTPASTGKVSRALAPLSVDSNPRTTTTCFPSQQHHAGPVFARVECRPQPCIGQVSTTRCAASMSSPCTCSTTKTVSSAAASPQSDGVVPLRRPRCTLNRRCRATRTRPVPDHPGAPSQPADPVTAVRATSSRVPSSTPGTVLRPLRPPHHAARRQSVSCLAPASGQTAAPTLRPWASGDGCRRSQSPPLPFQHLRTVPIGSSSGAGADRHEPPIRGGESAGRPGPCARAGHRPCELQRLADKADRKGRAKTVVFAELWERSDGQCLVVFCEDGPRPWADRSPRDERSHGHGR